MQGQSVEEVMAEDERRSQERRGGLSAAEYEAQEIGVWGTSDRWRVTLERLQDEDAEVQERVAEAVEEKDAREVLASVMDVMLRGRPAEETDPVKARVDKHEARTLAMLTRCIGLGTPAHLIAQAACNAVLRGEA
jgi:hypothetical protein